MIEENLPPENEPDTIYVCTGAWPGFTRPMIDGYVMRLNDHVAFVSLEFVANYGWLQAIGFVVSAYLNKQTATVADVA